MENILSDREREVAYDVAKNAMVMGWDRAIGVAASQYGVSQMDIRIMLDKASAYNAKADPAGRIAELDDWLKEKRGTERASSSRTHLLSPGLQAYMEKKKAQKAAQTADSNAHGYYPRSPAKN